MAFTIESFNDRYGRSKVDWAERDNVSAFLNNGRIWHTGRGEHSRSLFELAKSHSGSGEGHYKNESNEELKHRESPIG